MGYVFFIVRLSIVCDGFKPVYQGSTVSDSDRKWINYLYLPFVARSDIYRELDSVVYDGDNRVLTEQERL